MNNILTSQLFNCIGFGHTGFVLNLIHLDTHLDITKSDHHLKHCQKHSGMNFVFCHLTEILLLWLVLLFNMEFNAPELKQTYLVHTRTGNILNSLGNILLPFIIVLKNSNIISSFINWKELIELGGCRLLVTLQLHSWLISFDQNDWYILNSNYKTRG